MHEYEYIKSVLSEEVITELPRIEKKDIIEKAVETLREKYKLKVSGDKDIIKVKNNGVVVYVNVDVEKPRAKDIVYAVSSVLDIDTIRDIASYVFMRAGDVEELEENDELLDECIKMLEEKGVIDKIVNKLIEEPSLKVVSFVENELKLKS